jgi:hypothetical protein
MPESAQDNKVRPLLVVSSGSVSFGMTRFLKMYHYPLFTVIPSEGEPEYIFCHKSHPNRSRGIWLESSPDMKNVKTL